MAGYAYRLPRRYRYRGCRRGGEVPKPVLVAAALFLAVSAAGAHHVPHAAAAGRPAAVPAVYAPAGSNEALANQMAESGYGWGGGQAGCLDALWNHESGFSATAVNSSSGATGIPQLLPGAHAIPANWSDPRVQIRWGLAYIHGTYGTPCAAWAFEMSHTPNWY